SAAVHVRSGFGSRRAPASAGRPTRCGACLRRRVPDLSRRNVSWLPSFPLRSGGQQPLVLLLFPVDPGDVGSGKPGVDRCPQLRLSPQTRGKRDIAQLDLEAPPQLTQRAQEVELPQAVESVALERAARNDEPDPLQVAE